jgi:hypothetical protein
MRNSKNAEHTNGLWASNGQWLIDNKLLFFRQNAERFYPAGAESSWRNPDIAEKLAVAIGQTEIPLTMAGALWDRIKQKREEGVGHAATE